MSGKKKQTKATKIGQSLDSKSGTKKLKPLVRTILLVALVAVAIVQLLTNNEMLTEAVGTGLTLLGLVAMVAALCMQLRDNS